MAKYQPGETGNKSGRPIGSKNKIMGVTKQEISEFLTKFWPQIQRDFKTMEPGQRVQTFLKLLTFVLPQPRATDLNVDFRRLNDTDINLIVDKLLNDLE